MKPGGLYYVKLRLGLFNKDPIDDIIFDKIDPCFYITQLQINDVVMFICEERGAIKVLFKNQVGIIFLSPKNFASIDSYLEPCRKDGEYT